ncbi:hypothetical protein PtA15_5A627 [Puccinia triticina]|uniref:Uncharacterized protein n=1 Tax=Puccinia triticina TaxID=208348 RepID=A0ABY7CJI6_9BASI|nr:uncharacterized protein PtA15_5A627 [Puccinia triticina]WAQ85053.1 hypothetical protein PtA15_5A627 [Puccinia triticina]
MYFRATFQQYIALHSIFYFVAIVSPTQSGNLKFSEWEHAAEKQTDFFGEQFNPALSAWATPIIPATDLVNPGSESHHQHHSLGQPLGPDFEGEDLDSMPLSPGLQDMLHELESSICQTSHPQGQFSSTFDLIPLSPSQIDTWAHYPETVIPAHDRMHKGKFGSGQTPSISSGMITEMAQNIHSSKCVDQVPKAGPGFSGEWSLSKTSNDKNNWLSLENPKKRPKSKYLSQRQSKRAKGCVPQSNLIEGYCMILLLKKRFDRFGERLVSTFSVRKERNSKKRIPHQELQNISIFPGQECTAVLRVVDPLTKRSAESRKLASSYYLLIRWLYVLHEDWLKRWNIPTFMHRVWQDKLLDWLDYEISGSDDYGIPIIGIRKSSKFEWTKDDEFRDTQIKLIYYFSQMDEGIEVVNTAKYLLEKFKARNPSE